MYLIPYYVFALSPHLLSYSIGYSSFHLLDATLFLIFVFNFKKIRKLSAPIFFYLFSLSLCSLLTLLFASNSEVNYFAQFRYFYYLIFTVFMSPIFTSRENMFTAYKTIVYFAVFFLLLQWVYILTTGIYIPGYLPFLPLMREELQNFSDQAFLSDWFRPRSIFNEPSNFGLFVGTYFFVNCLKNEKIIFSDIIISISLMLSFSTTGLMLLIATFVKRIFSQIKILKVINLFYLSFFLALLLISIIAFDLDVNVFGRIEQALQGRLEGYSELIYYLSQTGYVKIMIGTGFGSVDSDIWLPSLLNIFLYYGVAGVLSFFLFLFFLYRNNKCSRSRSYILILLLASFTTELALNSVIILFLILIISHKFNNVNHI